MVQRIAGVIVLFYVITFSVSLAGAAGNGPPNHPKLLDPNKDRVIFTGLPPEQTRTWTERVFPNGQGTHTALCIENLTLQRIFPGAAPAVGEGVFCLADITPAGQNEFHAIGFLSGCLRGGKARQLLEFPHCQVLVENGSTTTHAIPRHHAVTCSSAEEIPGQFDAKLETISLTVDNPTTASGQWRGAPLGITCNCPVDHCDPCCATCLDDE